MNHSTARWVCPNHTPKPDSQYFEKPFDWFVKKYCKLGFSTGLSKGPNLEFMWVYVTHFETIDNKEMLVGRLDNDPLYVNDYKFGDGVAFDREEICMVQS